MNASEFKKQLTGKFTPIRTANYNIALLVKPPKLVLIYDGLDDYKTPKEVLDFFENNKKEGVLMHSDGYVYFQDELSIRKKNVQSDIERIIESKEMKNYMNNITNDFKINLTPEDWTIYRIEQGLPDDSVYINATFNIPNEEFYKLCVLASKKENTPTIKVSVFLTHPEKLYFYGTDSRYYPIYQYLVRGKVTDEKVLESEVLKLKEKN